MTKRRVFLAVIVLAIALGVLGSAAAQSPNPMEVPVDFLVPNVLNERPHDTSAYTQGLLYYDGALYESTGAYERESMLRELDPETGEVRRMITLPREYFAEGLERVDDTLIQLTWQSNVAFVYDLATFEQIGTYEYEGEGWGLCSDGRFLYMSDGTPFIQIRDRANFELLAMMAVTLRGQTINQFAGPNQRPLSRLNELECAGDSIYANVWMTDLILRINKINGVVTGVIDASSLYEHFSDEEKAGINPSAEVLNGIVYLEESDTFLITGKNWPKMFEVTWVPAE